jgi:hypothetical protein
MAKWLQEATEKMKKKGTIGKFGKATPKKIAAGKRAGGVKKKEAIFAQNAKKAAQKRKHKRTGYKR